MKINIEEEISGHRQRDEMLRQSLRVKGVDLGEQRSVELHFWAFNKRDAVMRAKALYDDGLLVLALAPVPNVEDERWNVEAGAKDSVEHLTSEGPVRKFVELAAKYNAKYDGWGTLV